MDYPDRWKDKLADEEKREKIARRHWRPTWRHVLVLLIIGALFALVFWPNGCIEFG